MIPNIIFRNDDFAIIEKPAGLTVHPGAGKHEQTLVDWLKKKIPQIEKVGEDPTRPGIVHRLDKETSGLMIIALSQPAFLFFKKAFQERKIEKTYLAWVWGIVKKESGTIENFIGRSKSNPLKRSWGKNEDQISNPKKAITDYQIIKIDKERTLISAHPRTGRMHQIRVHFHSIGHPIIGDKKYFNKKVRQKNTLFDRQLLHAWKISFRYSDGSVFEFESQPPKDFNLPS